MQQTLTVNLRLPHGITHTPQAGNRIKNIGIVGVRLPHEEDDYERGVNDGTQGHQRLSADEFH